MYNIYKVFFYYKKYLGTILKSIIEYLVLDMVLLLDLS